MENTFPPTSITNLFPFRVNNFLLNGFIYIKADQLVQEALLYEVEGEGVLSYRS